MFGLFPLIDRITFKSLLNNQFVIKNILINDKGFFNSFCLFGPNIDLPKIVLRSLKLMNVESMVRSG